MKDDSPASEKPKSAQVRNPPADAVKPPKVERRSVSDWRDRLRPPAWLHAPASSIHGWRNHKDQTAAEMRLTREDYEKALEAARRTDERGKYVPHAPALSEYKRRNG